MKRTRTEITIEFDEVIQSTDHSNGLSGELCLACGGESFLITPQQAAVIAGVTVREINRRVESEMVHYAETTDGFLLVCVNSLRERDLLQGEQNDELTPLPSAHPGPGIIDES